jgi:malonyl-CoA decarboxylase
MNRPKPAPVSERASSFLNDLLNTLTERGRNLLSWRSSGAPLTRMQLIELAETLLSRKGEATGVALARTLLEAYANASREDRLAFLDAMAEQFGPDETALTRAIEAVRAGNFEPGTVKRLHKAAEPRRQELIRRLNLAPGGTSSLVKMREELLAVLRERPQLSDVDDDFVHLFSSWFNRGFLVLRRIDWTTPANILEKIIRYEAVHAIENWEDLRNRLAPPDRRCYGFFHPQLVDEPLIFVEVALTRDIPPAIAPLLDLDRKVIGSDEATTAVFYSISNTQRGLGGISFGNFLIKQVVEDLKRELPNLTTFVTLSPVPGFADWLSRERKNDASTFLDADQRATLTNLDVPGWADDPLLAARVEPAMLSAAAAYFLTARTSRGGLVDPVARFHLGNGARLERLNVLGDRSDKGMQQSHGLMVNYLYALNEIESNHEAYAEKRQVAASSQVRKLLTARAAPGDIAPLAPVTS